MSWKNNWVFLNACGFGAGAASSLIVLYLAVQASSLILLLVSPLIFGALISIFQCIPFMYHKKLIFRWILSSSALSLLGVYTAASGLTLIFVALFLGFTSTIATFILVTMLGVLVFSFTGFLISNGQTIVARNHILRARSWVLKNTLAFAVSGAIFCPVFLLIIFMIPVELAYSIVVPIWGALSGLLAGAVFGFIMKSNFNELVISIQTFDNINSP